jgi:two-component system, chemotaxis family, sensor kinase CheA
MRTPLLERFVSEARELLQGAATALLILEKNPEDEGRINEVFRSVHTLKGSAGLFDFPAFSRLVHAGEDVLSAVRAGEVALNAELVDLMLDSLDQVSGWIDRIDSVGAMPDGADGISREMTASLRAVLPARFGPENSVAAPVAVLTEADWLHELDATGLRAALAATRHGGTVLAVEYVPAKDCFFSGEDPLGLLRELPGLVSLEIGTAEPLPPLDVLDPYCCLLRFRVLTTAPRHEIEHLFRYVIEQIRLAAVMPEALASIPGASAQGLTLSAMAARVLDSQRVVLDLGRGTVGEAGRFASVGRTVGNLLAACGGTAAIAEWDARLRETAGMAATDRLIALLDGWLSHLTVQQQPVHGLTGPRDPVGQKTQTGARPESGDQPEARPANRVLKVDQARIDTLMNLIGELVVSKNSLPFLARRAESVHGSREMSREIKDVYSVIDRLAQEMQSAIMAVRMLPVSEVFDRFPRLVRDVARKLGKHIELVIHGEDTVADKNIIEVLGDPLLHIIRNSIDHGIEPPEEREAAGKPAQATVMVRAFQESDQVVIEVTDDGCGIDPEKIKASAQAKGIVDADAASRMSDQDAVNLVFRAGFSTAASVSDLSGRGVGMDVVLTTVEKAGGSVKISSRKGDGTAVRLSLPLTMAVTRVMMVEAGGGMLFGIPMDQIAETVRVPRSSIRRIKLSDSFVLRDTIVPVMRLDRVLGLEAPVWIGDGDEEDAVLVVRVGGSMAGLVVDHFREGMDVVLKPFAGVLSSVAGYAGTALLGDGRVLLVLNLKELL